MSSMTLKVDVKFNQLKTLVKQLSPEEKLELNNVIWDTDMDIPASHQKLVLDRIKKSKADQSRMLDWDKASKMLKP